MKLKLVKYLLIIIIPAVVFVCASKKLNEFNFSYINMFKPQASLARSANVDSDVNTTTLSFSRVETEKYIKSNAVPVKAKPNDESEILFSLDYADFITVTGDNNNNSYGWVQIEFNGITGYIDSSYLSDEMLFFDDYNQEMYINQDYSFNDVDFKRNDCFEKLGYNSKYIQIRKDNQVYIIPYGILSDEKQPDPKYSINYNYINSEKYVPIIEKAYSLIGTPYGHGYSESLTDCVGLTMMCYAEAGVNLPWSLDQAYYGESVPYSEAVPGDIIIWSPLNSSRISHVGIYVGEGQMIHASSTMGVIVYDVNNYIKYGGNMVDVRHISID